MKKIFKFLFVTSALLVSACSGGASGDSHEISEEAFIKEITNNGFCDYSANATIAFNMTGAVYGKIETIEGIIDMQYGKYHTRTSVSETYVYAEKEDGVIKAYYYNKNSSGEWVKEKGITYPSLYKEVRQKIAFPTPAFAYFSYDKATSSYKCIDYHQTELMDIYYSEITFSFTNNKLTGFSYKGAGVGEYSVEVSGIISGFGAITVNLPDEYVPMPIVLPTGRVDETFFNAVARNTKGEGRTAGSSTVHVSLKQNGRLTNDDSGSYTYKKENDKWTVSGEGTGSAESMKTAYSQTINKYLTFLSRFLNDMDSHELVFEITEQKTFKATLSGKLDFEKFYGRGYTGLIDLLFELEWDEVGMLTYWHLVMDGDVSNGTTTIKYQEEDTIRASWN